MVARRTTWIEQGPLFALSTKAQLHVLPLPEDLYMGWGIEALWYELSNELNLGIIDAVRIRHLGKVAHSYDRESGQRSLEQNLARMGYANFDDMMKCNTRIKHLSEIEL